VRFSKRFFNSDDERERASQRTHRLIDGEVFHCFVKAKSASGFTIQKTTSFSFHLFSHLELMGMTEFEGRAIQFLVD